MSKWNDWPLLAFDVETTGVNVAEDRIVTAALVEIRPDRRPITASYIVDPGIEVPEAAATIHGYTRARAVAEATHTVDQMLFEVTGRLAHWMGHDLPVVVFNGAFDLSMLEHENHRHGIDPLTSRLRSIQPVLDVHVIDKFASYRKGSRKLIDVCRHYGIVHTGAHGAAADALATARLFPRVMEQNIKRFPGMTLPALHQSQVGWRRAQCDSLRAYFDKQGTPHDGVDGAWPLLSSARALPAAVAS